MDGYLPSKVQERHSQLVPVVRVTGGVARTVGEAKLGKRMVVTAGLCAERQLPTTGFVMQKRGAAVATGVNVGFRGRRRDRYTAVTTRITYARGLATVGDGTAMDFPSNAENFPQALKPPPFGLRTTWVSQRVRVRSMPGGEHPPTFELDVPRTDPAGLGQPKPVPTTLECPPPSQRGTVIPARAK